MISKTKQCSRCNKILPIDDFKIATKEGHRRGECKTCVSIKNFIKRKPGRTEDDYWKWQNEIKEKEKLFNEGKKKCTCCGEIKLITEFNKGGTTGHQPYCRVCSKSKFKTWHTNNNEEIKVRNREKSHNRRTPEEKEKYLAEKAYKEELHLLQKEGKRRCRVCNTIKILDEFPNDNSGRVYYGKKSYCKCCATEKYHKPYRQSDIGREKKSINDKKYRSKPGIKEKVNEQRVKRYHNDPAYKLKVLMRGRLTKVLDRKKQSKRFTKELGCTFDELVIHLESQFYPDPKTGEVMTWDNHSMEGWHVDHIKPLHEFDLYDDEQFKEAAHYTNLQPLWWWQNLEKNRGIKHIKI
tara:strand:- start:42 stop:1094 length:1053 start_codon:yes stop_codon:yes gene_type:complete